MEKTDLLHSLPNRNKERRTIRVKLPRKKPLLQNMLVKTDIDIPNTKP